MDGNSLYISIFLESSLKPVNVDGKKGLWFYKKKSTLNNKQKTQQHCFLKKGTGCHSFGSSGDCSC